MWWCVCSDVCSVICSGDGVSREYDGNLDHLGCCSDALQQDWPVGVCEIVNYFKSQTLVEENYE